jgi:hypothetical protein
VADVTTQVVLCRIELRRCSVVQNAAVDMEISTGSEWWVDQGSAAQALRTLREMLVGSGSGPRMYRERNYSGPNAKTKFNWMWGSMGAILVSLACKLIKSLVRSSL